ncbi:strawberry notch C-terminal domain-containing protein [Bacteroides thetaiotaomicron]|uniref:LPD38 domain-containing protein n=2 Tax=Bacteroidaceae TaxID=815 RepID=UPI002165A673|nr:LPD38 domain-containing protein [Bacteroides thetaiotaomicron]MCS2771714.1 strawberry notch C-terminal domain-containing protein [Bacteroides thetaiotaomicron]
MPENEDKIKKLYDTFVSDGYDMESEEDFRKNLSDSTKRKAAYDALVKDGYEMEPFEEFENNIGFGKIQTPAPEPAVQTEQAWQPTEQEKAEMIASTNRMMQNVETQIQDANERVDNIQEYGLNPGLQTKEGKMQFNPENGKLEKTYITPLGNKTTSKPLADIESFWYRQAADMSIGGQLRKANLRLQELKAKQAERASEVHKEWVEETEKNKAPLAAILGAATYTPRQQSDKENSALRVAIRETEELIKNLEEQKDRENGVDVGFWRGFGRTMGDVRTWDFGMGDMADAMTMMNADKFKGDNATEGERESYDMMMGAIHEKQQAEERYGGNADFWNRAGVMTGYMPSFMLDFILTGGGFNGLSTFSKGSTKVAAKVIGKETAEKMAQQGFKSYIKENGVRGLGQYATDWTIKALGTTADDLLVRAPLMTNTIQAGKTVSDIIDRKLGDVVVDENGNYDFSNDKTWGSAIWQGEANAIIENYSEMFGAHLDPILTLGNMSKLANVLGAKRLGGVLSKADAGALNSIMGQTHQMFNKMGVSDYVGEVSEEYYGQLWRTMLNLDDAYQQNPDGTRTNLFATGQFHGDIWGGMALSMGLMGAGKHTLSAANYASMKHGVNKADAKVNEMLGNEIWEPLRATLDLTTNENVGEVAELIAKDQEFTTEEKAAVLEYMEHSLNLRGFNLGTLAQKRGGEQDENVQAMNESYLDGYNIASPQEMNDAKNMLDYQRQRMIDVVGTNDEALEGDAVDWLNEARNARETGDTERAGTIIDYLNAKQVYDGMIQRVRDDIDGRVEQSNSMIDARVNRKTGMIQGATMKQDERKVYVLSGTLVPYTDGSGVSVTDSDNSIIVRDADTGGLEQVSPDAILSIDDVQDPYEQKELAAQSIREQFAREAADKIDGVVTFNPGETYTIAAEGGSQIQVTIVSDENGIIDNGDGTINVTDGTNVFPVAKEAIQQSVDAFNIARIAEFEQQRTEENLALQQEEREAGRSQYAMNDLVTLRDENGIGIRGNITADVDADGLYEVYTEDALNGKRVNMFTREELDSMLIEHNGQPVEIANSSVNDNSEVAASSLEEQQLQVSALERIPKDEQGNPIYEQAETPDLAWDAIVEQTEGDEAMAQSVANGMVADKEAALKKIEKTKSAGGNTIAEKIVAEKERKAAIDAAKQELSIWQKIAGTANRRKMEADAERRRIADEATALRKAEEEKLRAEREEAERKEREALNGVPDIVEDVPKDARARGYRRVNGHKVDRQEPLQAVQGKEVNVKFSNDVVVPGNVTVIDASLLQPSHIQGVRNPLHFIDEAQPKERNDEASVLSARKIAGNIRPEEITSSITAYTGAPTVNERGEVIQGNNRSDALRLMWESHSEQAEAYRQYLKDHAEEFGLRAEDIAPIQSPVLVNMLHVDDTEALNLGQFVAQDTESGGVERIKPKNTLQRMGTEMRSFANLLLRTSDDEMSFAGLVDANGANVLKWMSQRGFISPTQYKSAFDSKGNLTPESKNDLRGIMYQSIFKDGSTRLEEMFNVLPVKAQKAILATAFRDYDSPNSERMVDEIQNSVRAYYALSQDKMFVEAKNFKEARTAVESWKRQYQMDDVTGESYLPADNFSNFVLHLAAMYKGESQSFIQNTFGKIYDLIQGTQEETLFEQPDNTPRTLVQAIKEALNLDYNGQQRSNVLVGDTATSQRGQQGSNGTLAPRERVENGNGTTDDTGRTESIGGQSEIESSLSQEEMLSSDDTDNQLSAKIARRIEVQEDDWIESGKYGDTYKQTIIVDGTHKVIKVDAPDTKGNYIGSAYEYDGQTFGDLLDVLNYIDASLSLANAVAVAEKETDTTPTEKQKEAGNYKKGHVQVGTFNITIENPKGSVRSGIDTEGNKWETIMQNTYGYIRGTEGVDGDHIDVFLSDDIDGWNGRRVFVVDQYNEDGSFDEHKVMLGFNETDDAEAAYFANYDSDWANNHKTVVTAVNLEDFEKWIDSSHRKTKAFAEYKSVKSVEEQSSGTQVDRLSEIKSRIEELHKEQEAAHVQSDIFEEARIISEINDLFAEQRKLEQSNSNEETTTPTDAAYTITPAQYTTKRGKVLDMHLVEFNNELRDTVRKHTTMFAKQLKGWWDKEKQGFMMRSKEDAERLAEYATDAQSQPPLSLSDLSEVNDGNVQFSEPQQQKATKQEERQEYTPIWQYSVFVDKETGETTLSRDDVSGSIPIGDARFRQTTNSPEEMLDILRNPQNGMQEVLDAVGISLENKIKTRELDRKAKDEIRDKRTDFVVDKEMDNRYSVRTLMKMIDAEKQAVMDLGEKRGGDVYHEGNIIFLTKDSADKFANEVRTLINDMRSEQQQDNSQKKTEASGNRLVTDERYAELRERMRKKLLGQMNIGIDPEILAIGTEMAVYHLEKGSRKFAEYATAMIADLGDAIRPYLKAFYNGARDLPEVAENGLDADMTPYDEVQQFDVANFDKKSIDALATAETVTRETEVEQEAEIAQERIKKSRPARKKNEKKAVNSRNQTGGLFGDLLTENDKADAELHRQFAMTVKADMLAALDNGTKPYRSILDLRKRASELGMEVDNDGRTDILLQELVEDGLVRAAREVIERKGSASRESYDLICKLYEMQPTISARSSNRIKMQQYSTPLPMAWIAGRFAMADKADGSVLEPTAGNGMLVFTIPVGQVHVNELDKTRLDNLREQGFAQVTQQDATEPFDGDVRYDVVIANPPFGKREAVEYDGKKIPGLDPQITLNALSSMKDDGRAAIIIGGNMEYANNGAIKSMKPFFTYLYDHYNVKGVIDMGGGLYAKQGTTFPTRMILIDGRRTNEERAQTAVYPPVENKAIRKAESFDDLYEIINEVLNFNEKTNGTEVLRSQGGRHLSVADNASGETDGAGHNRQSEADDESGSQTERRGRTGLEGNSESGQRPVLGKRGQNDTVGETGRGTDTIGKPSTDGRGLEQRTVGNEPQPVDGVDVQRIGLGLKGKPKKRDLTEEKLPYRPHNTAFRLESVAPAAMVEAMDKVLSQIEAQHGSIDEFVKTELGYDTIAETYQALAAEQMDSVAMAIYQMKQEQALIIGDQTGVGKGRQMAALIRWAVQRGEKPVFITQKADLFSDIYRDLVDVGSGDLVPFIFNSDGAMVDSKGNTVHKPLSSAEMAKVFASGALPEEYDFAVLTYSQVNTGDVVSQQEMEEAAKKSGARTKKSKNVKNGKATPKATFLRAIAKDNYLFLDESHTAAGSSNTGAYLQSILRGAKAATFASATFAKRPDTMPLYAIRTAMSQAKVDPDKMISIIEKGGVTLQEIMSRELTNAGQMVRRERDMSDVVTDWKTITDPETVRRARENYDRTIAAFNAIIKFQEDYVKPMIEALDMELAVMAESAGVKRGTDKMGVENVPFASKTYNYTKQLMLALKVNAIADEVEGEINAGRHPVIALESTMESSIKDYAAGEIIDEPTFSASLLKGLDTVMQYTVKDEDGNERHERYSPQALGPAGEKAYYELQDFIRESTSDIFISPLDAIIERLNKKGYKVGELTGRNMYVERNDDGRVVVKRRTDKDKKKMQREFNSGVLDVLILNKSASTGISLHASEKFSDQRQRSMIIAQPLSDINDYMQMIGRIDRTGQVHRGYYINLGLPVPAENRFLMMLSTKLKSLNANTTTSQDSESNDVEAPDLLNKYGSQVVVEYLRDNVDIYEKMGTPLKKGGLGGGRVQASELEDYKPQEDDARKITGYVALLATKEQEEFYDDVVRRYNELIKYLNDTGSNDLKITVMPLRATTIEKRISSEGIDPDGNNPFARNSFVEKVEMDVLRKPMKADEIRKVIEQINKGVEPNTYLDNVIETIRKEDEVRIAAEDERYEKSKAKAIDDIAKQTEKINGQKKRSDEEKRVAIDNFIAETNEKVEAKHKDNILRLNTNSDQMMRRLRMFEVGKSYLVPDNLESMIFDFATSAIFCGYKTKDSKITASTTLAVFATLDGRRRIEIKLSQIDALRSIDKVTNDNWDAARATTLDNWDSQIPSETRKTGFIMTGNILQAIADTQDEYGGYPGQLISYTDIDGNVHDGILMPDKWNASMLKTSGAPLSSRLQQIKDYTPITSHDGKVEIMGNSWAKMFYLTVPKTKKDGAVYYENKTLLRAAGGNFYPYRGKLRADIPEERIIEVVKELAKLGVKVKDDTTDILQRNGIGAYNDDEVSYENDPVAKLLGQSRRTAKQRREFARRERQRMAERVESLAEKLHLDNVEVVTDASVLDGKKQRAKGFYSKSTGKITIVIPNHTSTFDVEQTLLHEAVAHYGLRQLFGEHFDTFLDNVFNNADENVRRKIVELATKNGWDFRKATEEYLAGLAEHINFEEARKNGWWQRIKQFFFEMLDKLGFSDFRGVTLTDNELRYILWRSYENLKEGKHSNLFGEAADIAMQHKLRVGEFADTSTDDVLNRDGDPEIHERTLARAKYEQRVKSGMYQSQEALQDSMLGLKEAMTAILGKNTRMEDVDGFENAYLGENRLSSVNKAEADAFAHLLFKPMLEEVAKLAHNTAEREELTDYMMAKHGLERNRVMAERDAQKDFAEYQKQHPKSTKTLQDFIDECRKRDYAGLTALAGMEEIADAEAEAQVMVDEYENAHDTTALWSKVNAVSKAVLSKSYECGMMSKETYDSVRDMYEFYIPLRGFDEKTSSEAYAYLTHKQSLFNAPIKKAEGRRSKADDPFANLQSMAESAIMQGNRNKLVKQKFLNFALNHPSDLVSVSDLWLQYDAVADEWKPIFPDNIDINDSPEEVERKMNEFEDKMKQLAESAPDNYKHGKDAINIPYRVVENRNLRQHQVVVKRNGRDYVITINGNPRAAQALNGQTNPDNDISGSIGQLVHLIGDVNRTLSSLYTTLQPDFIASNFLRDMVYSNSMVWVKESPKYAIQYNMNFAKLPIVRMVMLLDKYCRGTLDMNDEIEKMFYQFMMNGGETGFSRMADIDEHKKEIKKMLKAANEKIPAHVVRECMATWIGEVGRGIEMRARFAAFVTSRNAGRTIDRSIWDAKEISVNFNKKGAGDKFLGAEGQTMLGNVAAGVSGAGRAGYIFWNAALQGTFGNFLKYAMRHPGKIGTVVASWYGLAMLVTALASAGGDDDDDSYYDIPEHTRRQNLIVKGPGNAWIKIPLPIEYRAVYAMGELTGSSLFHNEKLEVSDVLAQMSQLLPVDMMEGTKALWPSSVKPMVEVSNNESWYGSPIWKDTPYNKYMPNWTKAYKSANKDLVNLSETLNEVSGGSKYRKGTIDLNPAAIEYLLKQYTGGFFTVTNQIRNLINVGTGEKDFDWRYVPLANRMLMSGGDERNVGRGLDEKFFSYLDAYRAKASEFSAIKGDLSLPLEKKAELISEIIIDPEYVKMKGMERIYSKLKKAYDTAKEIGDTSKAEELEKRINELKRKFILEMEQDERK